MLHDEFNEAFSNVQFSTSNHQKYLQSFIKLYGRTDFEDFAIEFMRCIDCTLRQDIINKEPVTKILTFAATFCGKLAEQYEKQQTLQENSSKDVQTEPFLKRIIEQTLMYHDLDYVNVRYYSCQFITLIFQSVGDDANLSHELCDDVQDAMLDRITDVKPTIRIQAIAALLRLQDPTNMDCPVIHAFINRMVDQNPLVRREAVRKIAVCLASIPKIIARLRDTDHNVRLAAHLKCSTFSPKLCNIVDRQTIFMNGINEEQKAVKSVFENILLQKWLTVYEGDILKLLNALKLDADEEDIKQTSFIHSNILQVLFRTLPLQDIVETLSLNEDRILPMDKLSIEIVTYWYNLIKMQQSFGQSYDSMANVQPDLAPLCAFIKSLVQEKKKQQLDDWEYLDYQHTLALLMKLAGTCDISEEVGRRAFRKLLLSVMAETKLEAVVLTEIMANLLKVIPNIDVLSNEICMLISEIREPLVDVGPLQAALKERDLKVADIRVKMCQLQVDQENAIQVKDFHAAGQAQEEMLALKELMKDLKNQFAVPEKVKQVQSDSETICRCLDILIALLQHIDVVNLPVSLKSCKDEFVMSLVGTNCMKIYWRIFKCIVLYALIDKKIAMDKLRFICTPLVIYRTMASYDKSTLLISIGAIADLIRVHGPDIFSNGDGESISKINNKSGRRLYQNMQHDEVETYNFDKIRCEDIIDIILDMLDDDLQEIREAAAFSIMALLVQGLVVSPSLLSRVLLKWFNPLTEKTDQKIQQLIGISISKYAHTMDNSGEILGKAIVPTLVTIGNAPTTSPLFDIDIDGVLQCLAVLIKIRKNRSVDTQTNLAHSLCLKIAKKPNDQCVATLVKMLLHLELPLDDDMLVTELIEEAEVILEEIVDRFAMKNLKKYITKLKDEQCQTGAIDSTTLSIRETSVLNKSTSATSGNKTARDIAVTPNVQRTEPRFTPNIGSGRRVTASANKSSKKHKQTNNASVTFLTSPEDELTDCSLHTIVEKSLTLNEHDVENDMTIETPITCLRRSTRATANKSKVTILETSSDSVSINEDNAQKSKKRFKSE